MSYIRTRVARRTHRCEEYPRESEGCLLVIQPGTEYLVAVAFPDGDVNPSATPWSLKLCEPCATKYGRTMPPRGRWTRQP